MIDFCILGMIKLELPQIIEKIKESSGLSDTEINQKIEEKLKQLSGLISREGAAHIVANECGIKLFEQTSGRLQIKNILAGMRNVEVVGKVVQKFEIREFAVNSRQGKVCSFIIGDETGTIRCVLWNEMADLANNFSQGDVVKISEAYVRNNQDRKEIHLNDKSKLEINPPGEAVGSVTTSQSAKPVRKQIDALQESDANVEILGTIVQIYDMRFYEVCPNCNKKVTPSENGFNCRDHGQVNPDYSYVLNLFLDDGSENIRVVFFRNQVQKLIGKEHSEILVFKQNTEAFDNVKHDLLGQIVKIAGRVTVNQMFGRKEFVAQLVFPNPDPEEELKRLES